MVVLIGNTSRALATQDDGGREAALPLAVCVSRGETLRQGAPVSHGDKVFGGQARSRGKTCALS